MRFPQRILIAGVCVGCSGCLNSLFTSSQALPKRLPVVTVDAEGEPIPEATTTSVPGNTAPGWGEKMGRLLNPFREPEPIPFPATHNAPAADTETPPVLPFSTTTANPTGPAAPAISDF